MAPSPVEELALLDLERSNKGASKQRRDQINSEIARLRDLLPLPESSRQRLSQLQVMSLCCVFIRKCSVLQKLLQTEHSSTESPCDFSQALTGFILVTTRDGKLVYISENVTDYLGHSMVDMKTQGDSLFDIVDKRDHGTVQAQLLHGGGELDKEQPISFFCRMNMSRTLKRQAGFGDVKVMHVKGHFVMVPGQDPGTEQQVFFAVCSPLITPDVKESLIQNNTMIFKSVHQLDMNYIEITENGEYHLGVKNEDIGSRSWYSFLHPEDIHEAREKHIQLVKSRHEMGCMMTVRMITSDNEVIWVNIVMHVRQALLSNADDPVIVCLNQVISEQEAYQFKIQGQLFALYASRQPDIFFGSAFCAPLSAMEGAMISPNQGSPILPHPFFAGQQPFDSPYGSPPPRQLLLAQVPNSTCPQNVSQTHLGGRQGHTDTLKALKRKIQENFNTCKPNKVPRLAHTNPPGSRFNFNGSTTPLPSSFETNSYRNCVSSTMSTLGHHVNGNGPVQALYCHDLANVTLSPKERTLSPNSIPNMSPRAEEVTTLEQVVPEVTVPDCYLTPDPSPASSPEPHRFHPQETSKQMTIDPVLVAKHLCAIKYKQFVQKQNVKCMNINEKKKNLPSLDATFVDTFFDELDTFIDKREEEIRSPEMFAPEPVAIKQEHQEMSPKPCQQSVIDDFDLEEFLGLNEQGTKDNVAMPMNIKLECDDQQVFSESQPSPTPSSPISEHYKIHDEFSTFALTPESDLDPENGDDVLDPDSWVLNPVKMVLNGAVTNPYNHPSQSLPVETPLLAANKEENELYQLKQLLSSLTPSGVCESIEEPQ